MKKLIAILFMFSVAFTINAQEYKIINAVYSIESDDIISFSRIIKNEKVNHLTEGEIAFDNDGNCMESISKQIIINAKNLEKIITRQIVLLYYLFNLRVMRKY